MSGGGGVLSAFGRFNEGGRVLSAFGRFNERGGGGGGGERVLSAFADTPRGFFCKREAVDCYA